MSTISISKTLPQPYNIPQNPLQSQLISAYIRLNSKKAYLIRVSPKISFEGLYKLVAYHLKVEPKDVLVITKGRILKNGYMPMYFTGSFILKENNSEKSNEETSPQQNQQNPKKHQDVSFRLFELVIQDKQIFHAVLYQNIYQHERLQLDIKVLIKLESKEKSKPLTHITTIQNINRDMLIKTFIQSELSSIQIPLINNPVISSFLSSNSETTIELPPFIDFSLLKIIIKEEAVLVYTGRVLNSQKSLQEQFVENSAELVVTFRKKLNVGSLIEYFGKLKEKKVEKLEIPLYKQEINTLTEELNNEIVEFKSGNPQKQINNHQLSELIQLETQNMEENGLNFTFLPPKTQKKSDQTSQNMSIENGNLHNSRVNQQQQTFPLQLKTKQKLQDQQTVSEKYQVQKVQVFTQEKHNQSTEIKIKTYAQSQKYPTIQQHVSSQLVESPIHTRPIPQTKEQASISADVDTPIDKLCESFQNKPESLNSHEKTFANEDLTINYMSPQSIQALQKIRFQEENNDFTLSQQNPHNQEFLSNFNLQQSIPKASQTIDQIAEEQEEDSQKLTHFSQELQREQKKLSIQNKMQQLFHEQNLTENILNDITKLQTPFNDHKQVDSFHEQKLFELQKDNDQPQQFYESNFQEVNRKLVDREALRKQYEKMKQDHEIKCNQMLASHVRLVDGLAGELFQQSQQYHQKYLSFRESIQEIPPPQIQQVQENKLSALPNQTWAQLQFPVSSPVDQLQVLKSGSQQTIKLSQQSLVASSIQMNGQMEHKKEIQSRKIQQYIEAYNGNLLDIESKNAGDEKIENGQSLDFNGLHQPLIEHDEDHIADKNNQQSIFIEEHHVYVQNIQQQPQFQTLESAPIINSSKQHAQQPNPSQHLFNIDLHLLPSDSESSQKHSINQLAIPESNSVVLEEDDILGSSANKKFKFFYQPSEEEQHDFALKQKLKQLQENEKQQNEDYHVVRLKSGNHEEQIVQFQNMEFGGKHLSNLRQVYINQPVQFSQGCSFKDPLQQALAIIQKPQSIVGSHQEPHIQRLHILEANPKALIESKPQQLVHQTILNNQEQHTSHHIDFLADMDSKNSQHSDEPWASQQHSEQINDQIQPTVKFTEGDLLYTIQLDLNPKPKLIDAIAYEYHDLLCKNLEEFVDTFGNIIPEDHSNTFKEPFAPDEDKLENMMVL